MLNYLGYIGYVDLDRLLPRANGSDILLFFIYVSYISASLSGGLIWLIPCQGWRPFIHHLYDFMLIGVLVKECAASPIFFHKLENSN